MNRSFGCLFLVLCLAGCGASPRRLGWGAPPEQEERPIVAVQGGPSAQPQGNGQPSQAASGDARSMLSQFDVYMRQRGFQPVGPAIHNSNLPQNGLIAYAVAAQQNACYAFVAIGEQPGQDINMVVTDPSARQIGYDVRPDNHPYVVRCPGISGRVSTRVQMQSGGGGFYYTVYQGASEQGVDLEQFFTGGSTRNVQTAQIDQATAGRVEEFSQRLATEGFRRVVDPMGFQMTDRQERLVPLNLDSRFCYSFGTFGGTGARDTDVYLIDGANNELASDHGGNMDASLQYCPQQSGSYQLKVTMFAGAGPLFIAGYARAAAPSTPAPAGGTTQVVAGASVAGAGLEDNFRLLDSDMRARGYESFGEQTRGELAPRAEREIAITLEGGKCYAILAVGDNGVRDLDLILSDSHNREVDRDVEQNPRPVVRVCPTNSGTYSMHLRMFDGQGHFVYSAYRWPRGTRGPFGLRGLMYVRLAEMTQLLSVDQYTPDADFTPAQGTFRAEGETHTHDLQLAANRCYSVLVVGGEGMDDIDAQLTQGRTQLASDASRNAFPNVRYCTTQAGTYTLGVRATTGQGAYYYQLFTRPNE